jgi:hypothetical protein
MQDSENKMIKIEIKPKLYYEHLTKTLSCKFEEFKRHVLSV